MRCCVQSCCLHRILQGQADPSYRAGGKTSDMVAVLWGEAELSGRVWETGIENSGARTGGTEVEVALPAPSLLVSRHSFIYVHSCELESIAPCFVLFFFFFQYFLSLSPTVLTSPDFFPWSIFILTVKGTLMKVSSACPAPQPLSGILQSESLRKQQCYPARLVLHEFIVIQPQL